MLERWRTWRQCRAWQRAAGMEAARVMREEARSRRAYESARVHNEYLMSMGGGKVPFPTFEEWKADRA